jgi:hypothetical protein
MKGLIRIESLKGRARPSKIKSFEPDSLKILIKLDPLVGPLDLTFENNACSYMILHLESPNKVESMVV